MLVVEQPRCSAPPCPLLAFSFKISGPLSLLLFFTSAYLAAHDCSGQVQSAMVDMILEPAGDAVLEWHLPGSPITKQGRIVQRKE